MMTYVIVIAGCIGALWFSWAAIKEVDKRKH